jgi:hypothetical protein
MNYYKIEFINNGINDSIIIKCRDGENIIDEFRRTITNKVKLSSISLMICEGCKFDAPAQLAHMGRGGCLYQSSMSNLGASQ